MTETEVGRRGRGLHSAQVIVISWRDIPAQVNAQQGRDRQQVILSGKFQRAIDRAKRKAKIYTAHEDIAQWSRVSRPCGSDLAVEAQTEALRLERLYSREHLGRLGFLGGWEPQNKPADEVLDETDDHEDDEPDDGPQDFTDFGSWAARTPATEEPVNPLADPNDPTGKQ
jgi:Virulence factor